MQALGVEFRRYHQPHMGAPSWTLVACTLAQASGRGFACRAFIFEMFQSHSEGFGAQSGAILGVKLFSHPVGERVQYWMLAAG